MFEISWAVTGLFGIRCLVSFRLFLLLCLVGVLFVDR